MSTLPMALLKPFSSSSYVPSAFSFSSWSYLLIIIVHSPTTTHSNCIVSQILFLRDMCFSRVSSQPAYICAVSQFSSHWNRCQSGIMCEPSFCLLGHKYAGRTSKWDLFFFHCIWFVKFCKFCHSVFDSLFSSPLYSSGIVFFFHV